MLNEASKFNDTKTGEYKYRKNCINFDSSGFEDYFNFNDVRLDYLSDSDKSKKYIPKSFKVDCGESAIYIR